MDKKTNLKDLYSFPGLRACTRIKPHPGHPGARVVTLKRRQKKLFVPVGRATAAGTTAGSRRFATLIAATRQSILNLRFDVSNAKSARP
jgi:hypothetical protein